MHVLFLGQVSNIVKASALKEEILGRANSAISGLDSVAFQKLEYLAVSLFCHSHLVMCHCHLPVPHSVT